jgi:disulfide bond formation protein DsbB
MNRNRLLRSPRLPFALLLVAPLGLVGSGLALAHWLHLAACPLCVLQRMLYLLLALVAAVGLLNVSSPLGRRVSALFMAVPAATGAFVAGYQTWIQVFAPETSCSSAEPWWEQFVYWAGRQAPFLFRANGLCSDPAWSFLGLSIAEWSLIAFSVMTVIALAVAIRRR